MAVVLPFLLHLTLTQHTRFRQTSRHKKNETCQGRTL